MPKLADDILTMRQRLAADPASAHSLKKRAGGFLDAEFLAILLAVDKGDRELILAPKGNPSSWLRQLAQAADQSDDLNEVCAGLMNLS